MSTSTRQSLSIAIVGAGPGGLTLARLLQHKGLNATIFERELSSEIDPQGRSLDLHRNSGLQAIREADLMKEFLVHARYDADEMKFMDKYGNVLFSNADIPSRQEAKGKPEDDPHARPEIDREDLRAILLNSISEGTIQWGRSVTSVTKAEASDHKHTLTFADSSTETFDLVVGADGAWSLVRPLLTPAIPVYSGITFIDVTISDIDNRFPSLSAHVGKGSAPHLAHNKGILAQRQGYGFLRIYIAVRVPESWTKSFKPTREAVLELFNDGWAPHILELLHSYDESSLVLRRINALPVLTTWETCPGVTLIGDAAHLMSPFAGEGVNQAMKDALELALKIVDITEGKSSLSEGVRQYEENMFPRVAKVAEESADNLELFFSEDSPNSIIAKFKSMVAQAMSQHLPQ